MGWQEKAKSPICNFKSTMMNIRTNGHQWQNNFLFIMLYHQFLLHSFDYIVKWTSFWTCFKRKVLMFILKKLYLFTFCFEWELVSSPWRRRRAASCWCRCRREGAFTWGHKFYTINYNFDKKFVSFLWDLKLYRPANTFFFRDAN